MFEILSPSTARQVAALDCATVPSVQAYVMLEQDAPRAQILRQSRNWLEEVVEGRGVLSLPDLDVAVGLDSLCGG